MNAQAITKPQRRGACPGLSAPMPTGDGLLVRLSPRGTIPLAAFAALCTAARRHGNGVIEVTSRGNIQARGLSETSAPQFADAIAALDIAAEDGVPVLSNPLVGLDAAEIFDSTSIAKDLRHQTAQRALVARLSPKVSVVIDNGGAIGLDAVAADIRLRAVTTSDDVALEVSVGGDAVRAHRLGWTAPKQGVEVVLALLEAIARHSRSARARDILAGEGVEIFAAALSSCPGLSRASTSSTCEKPEVVDGQDIGEQSDAVLRAAKPGHDGRKTRGEIVGVHRLHKGKVAIGIALAFGHADATALERLAAAAEACGALGLRTAPGRALLAIGLAPDQAPAFTAHAEHLGFITRPDDPRRNVIACAGAPICASAHIASRALAPAVAADAVQFAGTIHISGCAKGCAHASAAALTVVGALEGCALIANGSVRDAPFAVVPSNTLPQAIANYVREHVEETAHV